MSRLLIWLLGFPVWTQLERAGDRVDGIGYPEDVAWIRCLVYLIFYLSIAVLFYTKRRE